MLDSLVDQTLLGLVAERDGLTVSETEVAEELKAAPEFQVNGVYNPSALQLETVGPCTAFDGTGRF